MSENNSIQEAHLINLLVDILGEYGKHYPTKKNLTFNCPVCAEIKDVEFDNKYNLEVNYGKGIYNCWACGESHGTHGTVRNLVTSFGNEKQLEQYKSIGLTYEYIIDDDTTIEREDKDVYLPREFIPLTGKREMGVYHKVFNYLDSRGITNEQIEKHNIGWCHEGKYENRIIIPSTLDEGGIDYFIARTFEFFRKPKYLNCEKDKELIVFNENLINWDKIVFLVEGPFDHVVTPNSIPLLGKVLYPLLKKTIYNKANNKVVVLTDPDAQEDGIKIYRNLDGGKLLGRVLINFLPSGYDPANFYRTFGMDLYKQQLKKCIRLLD